MSITQDFLPFPGSATVREALGVYLQRNAQAWWLLIAEKESEHAVCSFGSLLPYLTGRTPHIVHNIGQCAICSGMDPLLWQETGALAREALADETICRRRVGDLPLAALPVVDGERIDEHEIVRTMAMNRALACGVKKNGDWYGVFRFQMKGDLGGPPSF
ncbi:MAG: hypothetical protein ACOYZ7_09460 [Chloroflexota bacterium]